MVDDPGDVLSYDFAFQLGENLADFLHGAALGGANIDDENAVLVLFLEGCRERGEFAVEGVDPCGGDGGPFAADSDGESAHTLRCASYHFDPILSFHTICPGVRIMSRT